MLASILQDNKKNSKYRRMNSKQKGILIHIWITFSIHSFSIDYSFILIPPGIIKGNMNTSGTAFQVSCILLEKKEQKISHKNFQNNQILFLY